jgi:hypothetical protein
VLKTLAQKPLEEQPWGWEQEAEVKKLEVKKLEVKRS